MTPMTQSRSHTPRRQDSLLIYGLGYSGQALARKALEAGWRVTGTVRTLDKAAKVTRHLPGIDVLALEARKTSKTPDAPNALTQSVLEASHICMCAPTVEGPDGRHVDPLLHAVPTTAFTGANWLGYMSTTVVYGDWQGAWVDETSDTRSQSVRGRRRLMAEAQWQALAAPTHIFRLAGIYGPGRNALESVRRGKARIIDKPGQVFSRIHVEDIANIVWASILAPQSTGAIYNVCDDEPCAPGDVIGHACQMLNVKAPAPIAFEDAGLSPMGRSFYEDNKRVRNSRAKALLNRPLDYPSYREGLAQEFQRLSDVDFPTKQEV